MLSLQTVLSGYSSLPTTKLSERLSSSTDVQAAGSPVQCGPLALLLAALHSHTDRHVYCTLYNFETTQVHRVSLVQFLK